MTIERCVDCLTEVDQNHGACQGHQNCLPECPTCGGDLVEVLMEVLVRRYAVTITRTQTVESVVYVTAEDQWTAELVAEEEGDDGELGDIVDSSEEFVAAEVPAEHEVDPTGGGSGGSYCAKCLRPVMWPGAPGRPMPWVHLEPVPWVHVEPGAGADQAEALDLTPPRGR